LLRYIDEQAFRFNNREDASGRKLKDSERFDLALSQIAGKRLTFAEVTGKVGAAEVNQSLPFTSREKEARLGRVFRLAIFISECRTDKTFFSASSKLAYSLAAFLAEGFE